MQCTEETLFIQDSIVYKYGTEKVVQNTDEVHTQIIPTRSDQQGNGGQSVSR